MRFARGVSFFPRMSANRSPSDATQVHRIRLFLVEDQTLFASLLVEILSGHPRFEVVGLAATGAEARERLRVVTPDIVLVDLVLPDMSGLELIAELMAAKPAFKVVVCSAAAHDNAITMAFSLGVHGFVEKTTGIPELIEVLERTGDGVYAFSPRVSDVLRRSLRDGGRQQNLLPGDLAVLRRLAQLQGVREIAAETGLSVSGVYKVRQRIARRTGARTKRELIDLAVRLGLVRELSGGVGPEGGAE